MHKKVKMMENRDEEELNLQPRDKVPIPTPQKVNSLTSNPNNGSPNRNNNNKKIDIIPDDIDFEICVNGSGSTFEIVALSTKYDNCTISLARNGAVLRDNC